MKIKVELKVLLMIHVSLIFTWCMLLLVTIFSYSVNVQIMEEGLAFKEFIRYLLIVILEIPIIVNLGNLIKRAKRSRNE